MKSRVSMSVLSFFVLTVLSLFGQVARVDSAPPVPPFLLSYRYWPDSFVQWVGTELPYSMIEVYADRLALNPAYDVVLMERGSHKRIHYVNQPFLVNETKKLREEVHLVDINLRLSTDSAHGETYDFGFMDRDGKPVRWRFIPGSDVTDQGAGLTPIPESPVLVLMYRESGAVAGEGTALQVENHISEAELWNQVSSPPYFIAYHGAHTVGLDVVTIMPDTATWNIDTLPTSLTEGQSWILSDAKGSHLSLRIDKVDHEIYQISAKRSDTPSVVEYITVKRSLSGWQFARVRLQTTEQGEQHGLTLTFQPALGHDKEASTNCKFELQMARNARIANGVVSASAATNGGNQYLWEFRSPDWMRHKKVTTTVEVEQNKLTVKTALQ